MNLEQLKRHFQDAIVTFDQEEKSHEDIDWFRTENHDVIGIKRNLITSRERVLLNMLLEPYSLAPQPKTVEEEQWAAWIFKGQGAPPAKGQLQLIHFQLDQPVDQYEAFQEAWTSIGHDSFILLWQSEKTGIVLLFNHSIDDPLALEGFTEALSSDFYFNVFLLVGLPHQTEATPALFRFEQHAFQTAVERKSKQEIWYGVEAIPHLLFSEATTNTKRDLIDHLLPEDVRQDHELLQSITCYFKHNLNITSAARSLHLHRNSLQYRVDKFIEKTGIDIRQFSQASVVYLALLLYDGGQ
ncbi:PucR family transcriptional regulator [Halalkalibacterium halodurans]|uniref:PucR family transcriptional regulator n=1 Tax=Halalkalibacterium halodurans TaxID=86665 RepID=UPI0010672E15|nr:PucR family transcriptional regulator [Halalkalibacterium halodurans]MED3647484.1 PucR family transcriptional regulator [Halalkalibacterium halodurans]TES57965.1 PucR family transcriptional regulator [Halalkalibacterium halodurans]